VYPKDIEEDGEGCRVVCYSWGLLAVADNDADAVARRRKFDLEFSPLALATVPRLGLAVRHRRGVQFFATPDAVAVASMSLAKVAWMVAVCRGVSRRC